MNDLNNMSIAELQSNALGRSGEIGVHRAIVELVRRLEAAEANAATYLAECDSWRRKFLMSKHVGLQGRECRLCGRLGPDTQTQWHNVGCPFVATDTARKV